MTNILLLHTHPKQTQKSETNQPNPQVNFHSPVFPQLLSTKLSSSCHAQKSDSFLDTVQTQTPQKHPHCVTFLPKNCRNPRPSIMSQPHCWQKALNDYWQRLLKFIQFSCATRRGQQSGKVCRKLSVRDGTQFLLNDTIFAFININNLSDFLCAYISYRKFSGVYIMWKQNIGKRYNKLDFQICFLGQQRIMELEKQQYLDTFLHIVRSSRTKNEFLKNVQDFDNKFTEAFQGLSFQNKASYESFQSVQQIEVPQKPKNPFINQAEEVKRNYSPSRSNNFMTQGQYNNMTNLLGNNMNKMNIPPSRSQQQFFKPPQASKTFHAGFMPKQPQKPTYQYQQTNFPPKSPSYPWPTSQQQLPPYQQYPNYPQSNFEHETKQQYQQLRKMMANFNMGDKFMMNFPQGNEQGELSINSHQPSGIDAHPNEFLTAFTKDEETFGKYFKKLVPYGGKPQAVQPNPRPYMENRINPFANQ